MMMLEQMLQLSITNAIGSRDTIASKINVTPKYVILILLSLKLQLTAALCNEI